MGKQSLLKIFQNYSYMIAGILIFLFTFVIRWRWYVGIHEAAYLLGPHRIADPDYLANDITWGQLSPTNFLYDHLLGLFWLNLGDFGIVAIGRLVYYALTAWSLVRIGKMVRFPPWAIFIGYALWVLADQRIMFCGSPLEGFQPKALSYPLIYLALSFIMEGRLAFAGVCCGIATAFHIIIGGWGSVAIFGAMLLSRQFKISQICNSVAYSLPIILPVLIATISFNSGGTSVEQKLMDQIYVTFAAPHCCDLSYIMEGKIWFQIIALFITSLTMLYFWGKDRNSRVLMSFIAVQILVFILGIVAYQLDWFWLLKLFPFQLGNSIPLLFLFMVTLSSLGHRRPKTIIGYIILAVSISYCFWILKEVDFGQEGIVEMKENFIEYKEKSDRSYRYGNRYAPMEMYAWIKKNTPKNSIFITPSLHEFWVLAERTQVASIRHPPINHKIIDWKQRLELINGSKPFSKVGMDIVSELDSNQKELTIPELIRIREKTGATYYLVSRKRRMLNKYLLHKDNRYYLYDISNL